MKPKQQLNKYKIFACLYDKPHTAHEIAREISTQVSAVRWHLSNMKSLSSLVFSDNRGKWYLEHSHSKSKLDLFNELFPDYRTDKAQRNTTVDTRAADMKDLNKTINSGSILDIASLLRNYCVKIEITLERR